MRPLWQADKAKATEANEANVAGEAADATEATEADEANLSSKADLANDAVTPLKLLGLVQQMRPTWQVDAAKLWGW